MGKPTGFKEFTRAPVPYREPLVRLQDYDEIFTTADADHLTTQGARCMDCGVPFCQSNHGCPIDNLIPEWNDLIYNGRWEDALERMTEWPEIVFRSTIDLPTDGLLVDGEMPGVWIHLGHGDGDGSTVLWAKTTRCRRSACRA